MQTIQGRVHISGRHVMAAAGVLAMTMMATAASAEQAKKAASTGKSQISIMLMKPTAPKAGENQFDVMVKDAGGKPVTDADVSVLFVMPAMPAMKMPEMRNEVKLTSAGGGTYTGTGQVTMAGKWTVTVSVKQGGKEIGQKKLTLTAK